MTFDIEPTIRRAGPEDCEAVIALVRAFHTEDGHPISERGLAAVRAMLAPGSPHGSIMLLSVGPQAAGYGALCLGFSIEYEGREAFIDDIYVVPSLRGRGLGRRLHPLGRTAERKERRELAVQPAGKMPDRGVDARQRRLRQALPVQMCDKRFGH